MSVWVYDIISSNPRTGESHVAAQSLDEKVAWNLALLKQLESFRAAGFRMGGWASSPPANDVDHNTLRSLKATILTNNIDKFTDVSPSAQAFIYADHAPYYFYWVSRRIVNPAEPCYLTRESACVAGCWAPKIDNTDD